MKCPYCDKEMTSGVVQSARQIFFAAKAHKFWFFPDPANNEVLLSFDNWVKPSCIAYHCAECKKVLIDYSEKTD